MSVINAATSRTKHVRPSRYFADVVVCVRLGSHTTRTNHMDTNESRTGDSMMSSSVHGIEKVLVASRNGLLRYRGGPWGPRSPPPDPSRSDFPKTPPRKRNNNEKDGERGKQKGTPSAAFSLECTHTTFRRPTLISYLPFLQLELCAGPTCVPLPSLSPARTTRRVRKV
ncbi:hypothetical protein B296_00005061 [Ensete ventricosum]|uniref:Uncharacterized protein n=1 Tax=Ensete ventricosum TaxID=4639 RepID=A0A427A7X7_ENSVE|nr:hypothetical protein B296_00005061 [Ensete ventricosum]